ncbi:MAG: HEPN domain-containing protein [Lachnospiraceae bacterium]|nr:HEPN domain-containing protein [Lachnospiraceae bacterium]
MREIKAEAGNLAKYRVERSEEDYNAAILLFENDDYRAANNRAYYSIFHSLRAVLALDEYDSKKHSGIISEFRKRYVKTGIFSGEISDIIGDAFEIRNFSDYDDMFIASRSQTDEQIKNAKRVMDAVIGYLTKQGIIGGK